MTGNMENLNMKELLSSHPKTAELLRKDVTSFLTEMQNEMMKDVPKEELEGVALPSLDDETVNGFMSTAFDLGHNLEVLITLFDRHEVYICVYHHHGHWVYHLDNDTPSNTADSRSDGTIKAIRLAFNELETKLNNNGPEQDKREDNSSI